MTDKQIMIDGVDVSGCEYYDKNKSLLTCTCEEYACSECHNCYYKQLKRAEKTMQEIWDRLGKTSDELLRKEQECETLASQLDFEVQKKECLEQECEKLKAENYCLKRKISLYENLLKLDFTQSRNAEEVVQHANYLREQGRIVLIEENHKLKQTLTEIKEIAKKVKVYDPLAKRILQKISEVENDILGW